MRLSGIMCFWFVAFGISGCRDAPPREREPSTVDEQLKANAHELAQKLMIIDTHIDVPYRLHQKMENIAQPTLDGDFDYPRAKRGGLDVPFLSIYVPASYQKEGGAKQFADHLIDTVEGFVKRWPDKFGIVKSVAEVHSQFRNDRISLALGMENGAPIQGKLENLRYFYDRGIRYMTLTHSKNNDICDSSYDQERKWHGLSSFGKRVVAEMNQLGMMVDVSHVSDDTFFQTIEISKAPVIASHSSCRYFTPNWERNLSDAMIRLLAQKGGVIQIAFGSSFLSDEYRKRKKASLNHIETYLKEQGLKRADTAAQHYIQKYQQDNPIGYASITDVISHIDHVIQLVGADHVGLGSDFDGVGDSLPIGLKSVANYPNLIYELLKKGYSRTDIEKICSGNTLRVWSEVERISQQLQTGQHP